MFLQAGYSLFLLMVSHALIRSNFSDYRMRALPPFHLNRGREKDAGIPDGLRRKLHKSITVQFIGGVRRTNPVFRHGMWHQETQWMANVPERISAGPLDEYPNANSVYTQSAGGSPLARPLNGNSTQFNALLLRRFASNLQ